MSISVPSCPLSKSVQKWKNANGTRYRNWLANPTRVFPGFLPMPFATTCKNADCGQPSSLTWKILWPKTESWVNFLPSESVDFLSLDEVIAIHERLIERFGGAPGIRDHGLLESALFRPQTGYYVDMVAMATALFESLLLNHPFVDGNKRVAFFATDVFLRLNGWKFSVSPEPAYAFLIGLLERNECNFDNLEPWIGESIKKIS